MNDRLASSVLTFAPQIANGGFGAIRALGARASQTAGVGHEWSFTLTLPNVGLLIRNPTFGPIAAAQNNLFVTYVRFVTNTRRSGGRAGRAEDDPKETFRLITQMVGFISSGSRGLIPAN